MSQKSIDLWQVVVACICAFSMDATSIFAQGTSKAKNEKEILIVDNDEKNKRLPRLLTNESTITSDSAFSVEIPEWYEKTTTPDDQELIFFRVFGLSPERLDSEINLTLRTSVSAYLEDFLGTDAHQHIDFSDQDLRSLINKKEVKQGTYFDGKQSYPAQFFFAGIKFDDRFRAKAKIMWIEKRQKNRLVQHGLFAGVTLLLIGLIFGGLKLNSATSGFYQGRLQFFTAIVILVVIAAGVYFGSQIAWI